MQGSGIQGIFNQLTRGFIFLLYIYTYVVLWYARHV